MKEKAVDIKIPIPEELLRYYIEESGFFYSTIDEFGEIQYFSDDFINFFSIESIYEIKDKSIKNFIGVENWNLLEDNLISNLEKEEYFNLIKEINNKKIDVKWKFYKDNDKLFYFLIFKYKSERGIEYNIFKEALEVMDIPAVIICNNELLFQNKSFLSFSNKMNINDFDKLFKWLKLNCEIKNNSFNINDNWKMVINIDLNCYTVISKLISDKLLILLFIKNEIKEIKEKEKEIINVIEKKQDDFPEKIEIQEKQKGQIYNIVNKLNVVSSTIQDSYEINLKEFVDKSTLLINELKIKYTDYEEIIKYTSDNLVKLQDTSTFIDDIAIKIHLISINAAIESARTGEVGKGFAVISKEIAKLSTSINTYAKSINKQIEGIRQYTFKIIKNENEEINQSDYMVEKTMAMQKEVDRIINKLKSITMEEINKISKSFE